MALLRERNITKSKKRGVSCDSDSGDCESSHEFGGIEHEIQDHGVILLKKKCKKRRVKLLKIVYETDEHEDADEVI